MYKSIEHHLEQFKVDEALRPGLTALYKRLADVRLERDLERQREYREREIK
jgi:hypothetical protein